MGLNITKLVEPKTISLDDLKNKKIAVDASQMLYQFLSSIRQPDGTPLMDSNEDVTSHLMGISTRIPNLIEKGMKLVFVFDGKPPILKSLEKEERAHRKRLAQEKLELAKEEGDEELMLKYSKQTSILTRKMAEEAMELISAFGLPVIQAPSEAEAQCAYMAKNGDVWGISSTDYDSLLYSTPRLLRNLTLSDKRRVRGKLIFIKPEIIELNDFLRKLELNNEQLIILGILVGTDYNNKGISGIGPMKALKLVKENNDYEKMFLGLKPDFDWKEIYNIFKEMPVTKDYSLDWKSPNADKIYEILSSHDFNRERINKLIERLTKKSISQKGLSSFFNS
ncbi:flap endonuclease-1 [Candidatus Woesearchaeota archaeon]|nr:flap endonuclease-1 [Candidatus Woesearchaeota archaeon]